MIEKKFNELTQQQQMEVVRRLTGLPFPANIMKRVLNELNADCISTDMLEVESRMVLDPISIMPFIKLCITYTKEMYNG